MCDNVFENLIDFDLSNDNETTCGQHSESETNTHNTNPSIIPTNSTSTLLLPSCIFPEQTIQGRESLDNNPFDSVQKMSDRLDDPFEKMEKEACFKARSAANPTVEVKLGNLLSLSDDNLLDDDDPSCSKESSIPQFCSDSTLATSESTIYHSAINDLDTESPPAYNLTPESGNADSAEDSASSADGGANGNSNKTKSALEYRKRLLKLSISNSTFNSPVSRRLTTKGESTTISEDDTNFSPMSALFLKAARNEFMISAESPLKLVDDDLMSEQPPYFSDPEKDFDADLEMLKIPMLTQLPSSVSKQLPKLCTSETDAAIAHESNNMATYATTTLPDLAALRAKLQAKREEANNNQDVSLLIRNLKSLICGIDVVDDKKKMQANSLLESLCFALNPSGTKDEVVTTEKLDSNQINSLAPSPQPITRQGTFDMELQKKEEQENQEQSACATTISGEISHMTESTNSLQSLLAFDKIPQVMTSSSATYDGEPAEDRGDFNLPEVEFHSPQEPPPQPAVQPNVNDIMEQLSILLEQHQFNQQKQNVENGDNTVTTNPTFIVVMNTSQLPHTSAGASTKQRNSYVASIMENSFNDGSPDFHNASSTMRRRSQSLSIHDKVKFVQLNMHPPVAQHAANQQGSSSPVSTPPLDTEPPEFKTPARMVRRNSFSSGTPYTPLPSSTHFVGGSASARRPNGCPETTSKTMGNIRRSGVLETHHERQQHAIVRPMPMPHNMNTFKPDLKKKLKTSDSIMKSSGPLKATIPVKKVMPMLKTSPAPDNQRGDMPAIASSHRGAGLNSSISLLSSLPSKNKVPYTHTSTPMPLSRSAGHLNVATNYPNACSTPTVHNTPMKRSGGTVTKPRYSYLSTTPNAKQAAPSAAAAGLRRRTLTEFKAKSPIKPRVSSIGGASTGTSKPLTRSTMPRPTTSTARTPSKLQPISTTGSRTSSRLSIRTSYAGAAFNKNKENKLP